MGSWSSVICGIDFVDSKAPAMGGSITVANMSLGGSGTDDGNCGLTNRDALHQAICRAVGDGVTFAVAAGNSGADLRGFVPAAYNEVIAVLPVGAPAKTDKTPWWRLPRPRRRPASSGPPGGDRAQLRAKGAALVPVLWNERGPGATLRRGDDAAGPVVRAGAGLPCGGRSAGVGALASRASGARR